jgi:hypothetical protein
MDGAMERELSVRQRRFAAEIAAGHSRAKAYAVAYPDQRMKKSTLEAEAKKAAKHPKVRAEVARLSMELLPPVENLRAAYQHALSTILRLTIDSRDDRLRFDAARWLVAQYEKREELEEKQSVPTGGVVEVNREAIIRELKELYRRALPELVNEPPLVEVVAEDTPSLEPSAPGEEAGDPAGSADGEEDRATTATAPAPQVMERITPAGYFPPKFRRIPAT